jgi:sugar/nucleoside kinase (ribokinase family)
VNPRLDTVAQASPSAHDAAPAGELDAVFGGSLFCDLVFADAPIPQPGQEVYASSFALTVGGTANRAVAAARLGMKTGMVAVLGADPLSDVVRAFLEAEPRMRLDWIQTLPGAQVPVTVALTSKHDRGFITYEESQTRMPRRLSSALPAARSCDVSLAESDAPWVREQRKQGALVFGGVGWDASGEWNPATLDKLENVDVFIPNEVEAVSYTRTASVRDAATALAERVPLVVVTRGREGALAIDSASGAVVEVTAPEVDAVDPTGAGDVFTAALMTASTIGWELETRLRFASLAASLSVRSLGGAVSAPRPAELSGFIRQQRPDGDWADIEDWARRQPE